MHKMKRVLLLCSFILSFAVLPAHAQNPEHFYNAPENLNPDPNYVPGDFPLADVSQAKAVYQTKREALVKKLEAQKTNTVSTQDAGEIIFTSYKNETVAVLGYLRESFGVAEVDAAGDPLRVDMVLDINSLDTAVPGRNNRLLNIFFESMNPDYGTIEIVFDRFMTVVAEDIEGKPKAVTALGTLKMNGVEQEVSAELNITRTGDAWLVKSREPVVLLISDFNFGNRVYDLMKACNHKTLGNKVEVNVELNFKKE